MKTFKTLLLGLCIVMCACSTQTPRQTNEYGTNWQWENGTIVIETPERPAGQKSVLGLTVPKMEVVRVGFVGLGMRGPGAVERFTHIPGTQVVALCDYEQSRAERCQKYLKKASMPKAAIYSGEKGYEELCKRDDIDLVYIAADWLHHFPVAKYALENGKHVAIEVPSAMNLQQCWDLINMSEKYRKAKAEGSLTATPTGGAGTKVGLSDPVVLSGNAIAQRIKATLGITGLSLPRVHIDGVVWHLDVGSSHPGAVVGPKGWAVRPLKRYASWVQNVVRQFGPYPAWA